MFRVSPECAYSNDLCAVFVQVSPSLLAKTAIPPPPAGKVLHLQSIQASIDEAHTLLHIARANLRIFDAVAWSDAGVQSSTARHLFCAAMLLAGALDAMVVLETPLPLTRRLGFQATDFGDPELTVLQTRVRQRTSSKRPTNARCLDFNGLVNFWKHYYPFAPIPSDCGADTGGCSMDFELHLGGDEHSGPLLSGLLLPTLYDAHAMSLRLGVMLGVAPRTPLFPHAETVPALAAQERCTDCRD